MKTELALSFTKYQIWFLESPTWIIDDPVYFLTSSWDEEEEEEEEEDGDAQKRKKKCTIRPTRKQLLDGIPKKYK